MAHQKSIVVEPVFSLDGLGFVDADVLSYERIINKALSKYKKLITTPKTVTLSLLNAHLKVKHALIPIRFEEVFKAYGDQQHLLATTPFLLGLSLHQDFLRHFQSIQTIEVLENKPEGLFESKIGKRPLQLCLRRMGGGYFVCISEYIQKGFLNVTGRESSNSINILYFVEEKEVYEEPLIHYAEEPTPVYADKDLVEAETVGQVSHPLHGKMIG